MGYLCSIRNIEDKYGLHNIPREHVELLFKCVTFDNGMYNYNLFIMPTNIKEWLLEFTKWFLAAIIALGASGFYTKCSRVADAATNSDLILLKKNVTKEYKSYTDVSIKNHEELEAVKDAGYANKLEDTYDMVLFLYQEKLKTID